MLDTAFFGNEVLPALNRGLLVSLALIIPAGSLGFAGGVLLGCARAFGPRWLRRLGDGYTSLVRGVPLVVQLMMIYYALPKLGIYFPPFGAALTSFTLCTAAYQSEYVRGALLSYGRGRSRPPRPSASAPCRQSPGSLFRRLPAAPCLAAAMKSSILSSTAPWPIWSPAWN